jgi:hypothetical protein
MNKSAFDYKINEVVTIEEHKDFDCDSTTATVKDYDLTFFIAICDKCGLGTSVLDLV